MSFHIILALDRIAARLNMGTIIHFYLETSRQNTVRFHNGAIYEAYSQNLTTSDVVGYKGTTFFAYFYFHLV